MPFLTKKGDLFLFISGTINICYLMQDYFHKWKNKDNLIN